MAFNDGFYWYKNVLKKQLKLALRIYLSIAIVLSPIYLINLANASAAENWEYDVIPDQSQRLQIKGHKVDQYGAAVNDYEYNTKIDPKTAANKTKMGSVGFGRLLKVTGWGLLGSAALEALLEAVDWVIDPESQSIWRNKVTTSNGFACKNFGYKWQATNTYTCPADAFNDHNICNTNSNAKDCQINEIWADQYYTVKVSDLPVTAVPPRIYIEVSFKYAGVADKNYIIVYKGDKNTAEQPKEFLTPEQLADYANHTHPDYSNPELAPKLEPKYSPSIQTDLWKPSNPWEKENAPTIQEVNDQLNKTNPEPIKNPEITPNPDTGGSVLPSFCSWAATVCEWYSKYKQDSDLAKEHRVSEKSFWQKVEEVFDWTKDDSDLPEKDLPTDIPDLPIDTDKVNLSASNTCPRDSVSFSLMGKSVTLDMPYQPVCDALNFFKPAVLLVGAVASVYIVAGVRTKEEDQT